jgi:hypothetical protein
MGTQSGGDGGGWTPDELPELPPEWGTIVIPDDASELAQEATKVRRELRRQERQRRWRRRLHLPPPRPRTDDEEATTLGVPLLVISIAVIATLTSLFAIAWPTRQLRPDLRPTAVASTPVAGTPGTATPTGTATATPTGAATTAPTGTDKPRALGVPDVSLIDPDGGTLRLRGALPAVVLLVDGCDCSQLVTATAVAVAAVNPMINTVAVGISRIPSVVNAPAAVAAHLRAVVDPGGTLRAEVPGTGQPSALLVAADSELVRVVPAVSTVDDFRADLAKLS